MTKARDLASGLNGVRPFAMAAGKATASVTQAPQNGWNWTNFTVTYPTSRFTQVPVVALAANTPYAVNTPVATYAAGYSNTSFTAWVWDIGSQSFDVSWMAFQMTSSSATG